MINFLKSRCISEKTATDYGVIVEEGRISFPYNEGYKYRGSDKKFYCQKGTVFKSFFGQNRLEKDTDTVYICEGEVDALSLHESGIPNALSVPNGAPSQVSAPTHSPDERRFAYVYETMDILEGKTIVLCTDNDAPGKVLREELARRYGKERCYYVDWSPYKDANDVLMKEGQASLRLYVDSAHSYPIEDIFDANEYASDVLQLYDEGRERGYPTGLSELDKLITIPKGQLIVVSGVPGSGKSEFVDQIAVNLAVSHGWKWALASFENSPSEHIVKLIEKYSGDAFWDWNGVQRLTKDEVTKGLLWVHKHFYFIRAEKETPTIEWVCEKVRYAVVRYGINAVVVDPYNEIEHMRGFGESETEYISKLLSKLKRLATNHDIAVFIVAHPTKLPTSNDGKEMMPNMYSISGSAHWYNKADLGIIVHRVRSLGWQDEKNNTASDPTEVHIQKVRFKWVGIKGRATLLYDWYTGRYQ